MLLTGESLGTSKAMVSGFCRETPISFTGRPADDAGAIWNFMYIGREDRSHGVHNPAYELGQLAAATMLQLLAGETPTAQLPAPRFIARESTRQLAGA